MNKRAKKSLKCYKEPIGKGNAIVVHLLSPLKGLVHVTANKPAISMIDIAAHMWPLCSEQILVEGVNPQ